MFMSINQLFFYSSFIFLTLACSKEKIKLNESMILQTDSSGNVIGGNNNQWIVENVSDTSGLSAYQFYIDNFNCNYDTPLELKVDCVLPDTLKILPYPNPVSDVKELKIKLLSSKKICLFSFGYIGITGKYSGGGSAMGHFYENDQCECRNDTYLSDLHQNISFPTDDMKLTVTIVTEDGCLYTAEGYVMVNN